MNYKNGEEIMQEFARIVVAIMRTNGGLTNCTVAFDDTEDGSHYDVSITETPIDDNGTEDE